MACALAGWDMEFVKYCFANYDDFFLLTICKQMMKKKKDQKTGVLWPRDGGRRRMADGEEDTQLAQYQYRVPILVMVRIPNLLGPHSAELQTLPEAQHIQSRVSNLSKSFTFLTNSILSVRTRW